MAAAAETGKIGAAELLRSILEMTSIDVTRGHDANVRKALVSGLTEEVGKHWNGRPLLLLAAHQGHANAVELILKAGAVKDVTMPADHRNAAILAAEKGHVTVIEKLSVLPPAAKSAVDDHGFNAVSIAIDSALEETITLDRFRATLEALKSAGFDLTKLSVKNTSERDVLSESVMNDHPKSAKVLAILKEMAQVTRLDLPVFSRADGSFTGTRLILELGSGSESTAIKLLEAGFNPDQKDGRGFAPLHYALDQGLLGAIEALIEAKADLDVKAPDGADITAHAKRAPGVSAHQDTVLPLIEEGIRASAARSAAAAASSVATAGGSGASHPEAGATSDASASAVRRGSAATVMAPGSVAAAAAAAAAPVKEASL